MKDVTAEDFEKLNLRVGTIKAAKVHPDKKADFLLLIDLGIADQDLQLAANLKDGYSMEELVGKQVIVVENFKPEMVGSVESIGLLLMTTKDGKPVLISPEKETKPGVQVSGINNGKKIHHFVAGEHEHSKL